MGNGAVGNYRTAEADTREEKRTEASAPRDSNPSSPAPRKKDKVDQGTTPEVEPPTPLGPPPSTLCPLFVFILSPWLN